MSPILKEVVVKINDEDIPVESVVYFVVGVVTLTILRLAEWIELPL